MNNLPSFGIAGGAFSAPMMTYFEDFQTVPLGAVSATYGVGYELTNIVAGSGTPALTRLSLSTLPSANNPTSGVMALIPGTTDADISEANISAGRSTFFMGGTGLKNYFACRCALLSVNTSMAGISLLPSGITVGTDVITDPDTSLAAVDALQIHRHSSVYAGTTTQASWTGRLYESLNADQHMQIRTSTTSAVYYKFEIFWDGTAFHFGVDGVDAGSLTPAGTIATGVPFRPSFQVKNNGTATPRQLYIDYIFWASTLSAAR